MTDPQRRADSVVHPRRAAAKPRWLLVIASVAGLFVLALVISPARAGITHNRRSPSQTYSPFLPLTFGFGMQFETSNDQNRYDFPILIEYNFSQTIKLSLEPSLVYIDSKVDDPDVTTASGFGDTELTFAYEFLRERRYRPALTIEGITKFPTASIAELGDPGQDYGIADRQQGIWPLRCRPLRPLFLDRRSGCAGLAGTCAGRFCADQS